MLRGKFSFEDFLTQLRTIQKMGSLTDLLAKIPGVSDMMPAGAKVDPAELRRIEAMITSMTPAERQKPELINPSRQNRIARGSGTKVTDVAGLLQRFKAMREMMAQLGGAGGLLGKLPGVGRMLGGGGGAPASFDPAQIAGMGGLAPNRRAARAQKALAKREQRKALKKHKKRGKKR
jgi:signal recognition particle subunit SRP54